MQHNDIYETAHPAEDRLYGDACMCVCQFAPLQAHLREFLLSGGFAALNPPAIHIASRLSSLYRLHRLETADVTSFLQLSRAYARQLPLCREFCER